MSTSYPACFDLFDERKTDVARMILALRTGLPARELDDVAIYLSLRTDVLVEHLGLAGGTFIERLAAGGMLENCEANRLFWVARAYQKALEVLGTEANAREWLGVRLKPLGDACPLSFLDTAPGFSLVLTILGRMEHGVYS